VTDSAGEFPRLTRRIVPAPVRPERVLFFGTGNFLRAFAGWMIDGLNRCGVFDGSIVVAQATPRGLAHKFNEQQGLYTVLIRGVSNGQVHEERQLITAVSRALDPYTDFEAFLACARQPDLRFIISNTTEAGIVFDPNDKPSDRPPAAFPGKLTRLLLERYRSHPNRGFVLLPCELIERNGDNLREATLATAAGWHLDAGFIDWISRANIFANTLVDRIVPGYPHAEADAITACCRYSDQLLVASEHYHFWAIEAPPDIASELPLHRAGFNAIWTADITPYRERKVRILNGGHTGVALAAYLAGRNTVAECMSDPLLREYLEALLRSEIAPTVPLPEPEVTAFINDTLERFSNPFLRHLLLSISLNSVSKYKARLLPVLFDYLRLNGRIPARLAFALAALIAFYRGTDVRDGALIGTRGGADYRIQDEPRILETFAQVWTRNAGSPESITGAVLSQSGWWGCDLRETPGLTSAVTAHLTAILDCGIAAALRSAASSTGPS
jgi:tagaturonate reductase